MLIRNVTQVLMVAATATACGGGAAGDGADGADGADGNDGVVADASVSPDGRVVDETGLDSFCDGATWGGTAPTASTDVTVAAGQTVLIDCAASAGSITVEAGGTLIASRRTSSTLTVHGNVVVRGILDYGNGDDRVMDGVTAELIFADLDDAATVGVPFDPEGNPQNDPLPAEVMESDVGLWIMGSGLLTTGGQAKRSWSKLVEGAGPGDATFEVEDASGWQVGDKIVLTPTDTTANDGYAENFDESTVAAVDGNVVTLANAPSHAHAGCASCVRRGEAANLSRNVVIRSEDAANHAHIYVGEQGVAQLDAVELRWLGPERNGGPDRRAPLYFYRQRAASELSFVRHTAIWGSKNSFVIAEASDGVNLSDTVGYDAAAGEVAGGFAQFDEWGDTSDGFFASSVLAAKLFPRKREDGNRQGYLVHGIACGGGPGSGCDSCVATGVTGPDSTGFFWNNDIHLPAGTDQRFTDNVAHNNGNNGIRLWQNSETKTPPWENIKVWSNYEGIFEGAYGNPYEFGNIAISDSAANSAVLQAVPLAEDLGLNILRLDGATLGSIVISGYVIAQANDQTFRNVTFDGTADVGVTQAHDPCVDGNEDDPDDETCIRNWVLFENPAFPAGVLPFDFGWQANRHTVWEVRGFSSADGAYSDVPADFDLYRADNEVAGGDYYAPFDAWLVPR